MSIAIPKQLQALRADFQQAWQKLGLDQKLAQIEQLETEVAKPEIWLHPDEARAKNEQLAHLSAEIGDWKLLQTQLSEIGRASCRERV